MPKKTPKPKCPHKKLIDALIDKLTPPMEAYRMTDGSHMVFTKAPGKVYEMGGKPHCQCSRTVVTMFGKHGMKAWEFVYLDN